MFNQNNGPLEHLAANALSLVAGALCILAAHVYGAWMRQRGRQDMQQRAAEKKDEVAP